MFQACFCFVRRVVPTCTYEWIGGLPFATLYLHAVGLQSCTACDTFMCTRKIYTKQLLFLRTCFHIRRHAKQQTQGLGGTSTPIPTLPSTYSVHDFHSYGYRGTGKELTLCLYQRSIVFDLPHIAAGINRDCFQGLHRDFISTWQLLSTRAPTFLLSLASPIVVLDRLLCCTGSTTKRCISVFRQSRSQKI